MKLSIILTVYNKEFYLRKALDSLISQKGQYINEYEILAVNDGSTDGSSIILDEYMNRDNRIRVLTQTNQGLSMARNNGLNAVKSDYVWFVDADDFISEDAVDILCREMAKFPDVIPIYACTEGIAGVRNCISPNVKTGLDVIKERKYEDCGVFYVLKRSFLNETGLRFVPGIYHEDADFTPRMLYKAHSVSVVPLVLYTVVRTPGSITSIPNCKRAYDLISVAEENYALLVQDKLWHSTVGNSLCYHGASSITSAFNVIIQHDVKERDRFNKLYHSKKHLTKLFLYSLTLRYVFFGILLWLFPNRSVNVYKILK